VSNGARRVRGIGEFGHRVLQRAPAEVLRLCPAHHPVEKLELACRSFWATTWPGSKRRQAKETQGYIDRIRAMLLDPKSDSPADTLTHVKALMAEPRQAKSTR
jgi:hypothetical protein